MDTAQIASGIATQPLAWLLTLCLTVIVFLYRQVVDTQVKMLDLVQKLDADHRATTEKVIPLCSQMCRAIELLEEERRR